MDVVEAKICLLGVNSNSYMDAVCVYIAVVFSHPVYCLQCWYLFECFEAGPDPIRSTTFLMFLRVVMVCMPFKLKVIVLQAITIQLIESLLCEQ